ncbi:hypothetical protein Moror_8165 [Moniliophthora roreri MCA 2997]|uniref:F-box domain-containing protein n=2 Tax=Moniliophthora roreri TaxID=221103 RepID=V2XPA6_MONRO|nr:hypothetical protein Moror_8165 [Moniliophthora roreri MCA 2997]
MPFVYELPQEITDKIIDYLVDDIYDLPSVSLVSRSWFPRSHHHLFLQRSYTTISYMAFDTLYNLCRSKHSTISSGLMPEMRFLLPLESYEFCRLLSRDPVHSGDERFAELFTGVKTLELRVVESGRLDSSMWKRFTTLFQSVRYLRLFNVSFRDAKQFCDIALSLAALEELHLEDRQNCFAVFKGTGVSSAAPVLARVPQKLRKLTLEARLCTYSPQFTSVILSLATQIVEWVFLDIDRADLPTIGRIFSSALAKEQSWTFDLSNDLHPNSLLYNDSSEAKDLILQHIDLRHNQNVRHITFDGEFWWYVMEPFLYRKRGGSLTSVTLPSVTLLYSCHRLRDLGTPKLFEDMGARGDTVMDVMQRVDDILHRSMIKELHFTVAVPIQAAEGGVLLSESQWGLKKCVKYRMYEGMSGWDEVKGIYDEFVGCLPKAKKRDVLRPVVIGCKRSVASED